MARRGPEGKIQDAVIRYAREKYGALCKKNEVGKFFVGSGWPDYIVFPDKPGKGRQPFFIEFKAPGKGLTPLQENMREDIERHGYEYHVISSIAAGRMIVDAECA